MKTDERGGWTSASQAEYDLLCPGRHLACRDIPEEPASADADRGNRIHAWLAAAFSGDTTNVPELSDDDLDFANRCRGMALETIYDWASRSETREPIEYHVEERLWISFGELKHSGKGDLIVRSGDRILAIDFKSGRNEVETSGSNLQLRDLAVLAAKEYAATSVTVGIVQPYAKANPLCHYTISDLVTATVELKERVKRSNDPTSPRVPGPVQCRYCRAKGTCREFAGYSQPPILKTAEAELPSAIAAMNGQILGGLLPKLRMAEEMVESEIRMRLASGTEVPGWTLKPGVLREKISNPLGVWAAASAKGVTQEQFLRAVSVTKAGLKSVLKEATHTKGKELDTVVDECLAGNTTGEQTAPKLDQV